MATAIDSAGGQNGTIVGNVTYSSGIVGQAFTFDGSNSYVQLPNNFFPYPTSNLPNSARTTPFTIDLWFQTSSGGVILGQQGGICTTDSRTAGSRPSMSARTGTCESKLSMADAAHQFRRGQRWELPPSRCRLRRHVRNRVSGRNGNWVGGARRQNPYANTYYYQLGTGYTGGWAAGNGGWYNFTGKIEEVNIYQRPLSPQEISTAYRAGLEPSDLEPGHRADRNSDDDDHRQRHDAGHADDARRPPLPAPPCTSTASTTFIVVRTARPCIPATR